MSVVFPVGTAKDEAPSVSESMVTPKTGFGGSLGGAGGDGFGAGMLGGAATRRRLTASLRTGTVGGGGTGAGLAGSGGGDRGGGGGGLVAVSSMSCGGRGPDRGAWASPRASPAWSTAAPVKVTTSRVLCIGILRARVRVQRELLHAERLDQVDDVHHVAIGDALVSGNDYLELRVLAA